MTLTLAQALQLYAPLAGLLAVVFWLGVLSNRVATLEREARQKRADEKEEASRAGGVGQRLTILETKYVGDIATITKALEKVGREIAGIHRAIANGMRSDRSVREFNVPVPEES